MGYGAGRGGGQGGDEAQDRKGESRVYFEDHGTFEDWLRSNSRDVNAAIAARSALRVWPLIPGGYGDRGDIARRQKITLRSARAILTAVAATVEHGAFFRGIAAEAAEATDAVIETSAPISAGPLSARRAAETVSEECTAAEAIDSSNMAVGSAAPLAISAVYRDAGFGAPEMLEQPLWHGAEAPDRALTADWACRQIDRLGPDFAFWARWYRAAYEGRPLDLELQRRIAVEIEDGIWTGENAAGRVAERIAEIESSLGRERAVPQAQMLRRRPHRTSLIAKGLARQIDVALTEYRRTICNAPPEALEPLDGLVSLLDQVAMSVAAGRPEHELCDLIVAMAATIRELNHRLTLTRTALRERPVERSLRSHAREGFGTSLGGMAAGALFSAPLWAFLVSGSLTLIGADAEEVTDALTGCYEDLMAPEAPYPPEIWAVPEVEV